MDPEQLSDNARSIYNQIYGNVHADEIQALFDAGAAAYDAQNYEEAAASLQRVVDFDERYSDGYALYYLLPENQVDHNNRNDYDSGPRHLQIDARGGTCIELHETYRKHPVRIVVRHHQRPEKVVPCADERKKTDGR